MMDELSMAISSGDDGMQFELVAASLRADMADTRAFLGALAAKLEGALPALTHVERARDGLFKSTTHVESISIDLGTYRYSISTGNRGSWQASRAKIVGGIAIKTESLGVDAWIDALAQDLAIHAQSSSSARAALGRLIT
jgi:hypothetical protein